MLTLTPRRRALIKSRGGVYMSIIYLWQPSNRGLNFRFDTPEEEETSSSKWSEKCTYVNGDMRHRENPGWRRFFRDVAIELHVVLIPFDGVQSYLLQVVVASQRDWVADPDRFWHFDDHVPQCTHVCNKSLSVSARYSGTLRRDIKAELIIEKWYSGRKGPQRKSQISAEFTFHWYSWRGLLRLP